MLLIYLLCFTTGVLSFKPREITESSNKSEAELTLEKIAQLDNGKHQGERLDREFLKQLIQEVVGKNINEKRFENLESRLAQQEEEMKEKDKLIQKLRSEVERGHQRIETLEGRLGKLEPETHMLKTTLNENDKLIKALKSDVERGDNRIESLEKRIEKLQPENNMLQTMLTEKDKEINALKLDLETLRSERYYNKTTNQHRGMHTETTKRTLDVKRDFKVKSRRKQESIISEGLSDISKIHQIKRSTNDFSTGVAFSVTLTKDFLDGNKPPKNEVVIKFGNVLLNYQDSYNNYTGIFTAPFNGIYFLIFHIATSHDGFFLVDLKVNDRVVISSRQNPDNHSKGNSNSVVLQLSKGDVVWPEISGVDLNPFFSSTLLDSTFSGFLLWNLP